MTGRDDYDLVWKYYDHGQWSQTGWNNLGGDIVQAALTGQGPHDLDVFVNGRDDHDLVWRYYVNGGWSGWNNLGGDIGGAPAVTAQGPNDLDIFIIGTPAGLVGTSVA